MRLQLEDPLARSRPQRAGRRTRVHRPWLAVLADKGHRAHRRALPDCDPGEHDGSGTDDAVASELEKDRTGTRQGAGTVELTIDPPR